MPGPQPTDSDLIGVGVAWHGVAPAPSEMSSTEGTAGAGDTQTAQKESIRRDDVFLPIFPISSMGLGSVYNY